VRPISPQVIALYHRRMDARFVPFGPSHLAAIAATFLVPLVLTTAVRVRRSPQLAAAFRLAFATELIATWILWYWLILARGWISADTLLPMQLCDWAAIAAIVALLLRNQLAYELGYFWALSGTLQALLTPELFYDFPDLRFSVFFAFHGGAIASVLYLTLALGMRPWPRSIPRVIAWSLFYFVAALAVNRILGTNFGYLSRKPASASLLDLMGPWPIYDFVLLGLGFVYVAVLYSPFFLADLVRKARMGAAAKKSLSFPGPRC
jgi:hypothetical integral membrane protein (TIGR02206 family)